ncbi:protocadherin gamma-B5-like [Notolabrus celidotus]|uniref:protocadherin gamma-B5-like n=1 Tax=Notolabrus celidotus TaxID=1203425 RepID=UPI00148FF681|nr:protocadherin gamma-B5-like [Notolabrus celidotus]
MAFGKFPFCGERRLCSRSIWPFVLFLSSFSHIVSGQIRYTIPEELKRGSLIGNVAQDLGLDVQRLRSGRARIVTRQSIQYTELKTDKGVLVVNERIDREQLCGDATPCSFSFEVILENPMELHRVTVEITDINDNSPTFRKEEIKFEISESATLGSRFLLPSAEDADVGSNGLQKYILTTNDIFGLKQHSSPDGRKYAEMILQKSLDRESEPRLSLKLIAVDGGNPQRSVRYFDYEQIKHIELVVKAQDGGSPPLSSNVTVKIVIQDQNDNPPQVLYPVQTGGSVVAEMVPRAADVGYLVTKVVAVDVDSGQNAWLSYKLQKATDRALFEVGLQNGEIRTIRQVSDKDAVKQRLTVIVEDNGQPSRSATVVVNVAVADSFPEVLSEFTDFTHDKEYNDNLTFYLVLALAVVSFLFITCLVVIISVKIYRWRQSRVLYHSNLPVIPYYPPRYSDTMGTGTLPHVYNYEVCRTTDSRRSDCKFGIAGSQNVLIMDPNSTGTMQRIQSEKSILDEPDSPLEPWDLVFRFYKDLYSNAMGIRHGQIRYSIPEEMKKGSLVGNVAQDLGLDLKRLRSGRARIVTGENNQYTELKTDKGILVVNERIDREELCGDVTPCSFSFEIILENPIELHRVTIEILDDQNDNPPQVLYPVQTGGSVVAEMVPRAADVGYLVTKVVAVDVDSGQNAWLSYKLQKATDRALFEVGLQNGEIRTIRQVSDKDAVKQRLTVIVEDNGQPSRSATVIVNVAVADSFPEVLSEFTDFTHDKEYNDNLTFYLVLALAVVSFLFITCLVVIISVKIYRWRQSRVMYHSNLPVIPYYPPRYSDTMATGTLPHVYNYEVCRTTDSRRSDCKFGIAGSQNVLIMDPSSTGTMQRIQSEKSILDEPDSPLEVG